MTSGAPKERAPKKERAPSRLRKRADFQRAAKGARVSTPLFTLQMNARGAETAGAPARFGFTVTKKVSGAVGRNRIRRRLKEALRVASARGEFGEFSALGARTGCDYVFVARYAAIHAAFTNIIDEMRGGIARLNRGGTPSQRGKNRSGAS